MLCCFLWLVMEPGIAVEQQGLGGWAGRALPARVRRRLWRKVGAWEATQMARLWRRELANRVSMAWRGGGHAKWRATPSAPGMDTAPRSECWDKQRHTVGRDTASNRDASRRGRLRKTVTAPRDQGTGERDPPPSAAMAPLEERRPWREGALGTAASTTGWTRWLAAFRRPATVQQGRSARTTTAASGVKETQSDQARPSLPPGVSIGGGASDRSVSDLSVGCAIVRGARVLLAHARRGEMSQRRGDDAGGPPANSRGRRGPMLTRMRTGSGVGHWVRGVGWWASGTIGSWCHQRRNGREDCCNGRFIVSPMVTPVPSNATTPTRGGKTLPNGAPFGNLEPRKGGGINEEHFTPVGCSVTPVPFNATSLTSGGTPLPKDAPFATLEPKKGGGGNKELFAEIFVADTQPQCEDDKSRIEQPCL